MKVTRVTFCNLYIFVNKCTWWNLSPRTHGLRRNLEKPYRLPDFFLRLLDSYDSSSDIIHLHLKIDAFTIYIKTPKTHILSNFGVIPV